eukprot:scaffold25776_cov106-Isochrysis_galbana.AAC.4
MSVLSHNSALLYSARPEPLGEFKYVLPFKLLLARLGAGDPGPSVALVWAAVVDGHLRVGG